MQQPNQKLIQQNMDRESQTANRTGLRWATTQAAEDPDKVYEQNLKAYKRANPDEGLVENCEGTKELVNKATGKE